MARLFLFFTALVSVAMGQTLRNGTCSTLFIAPLVIDINQFTGTWYQIERIENSHELGDCTTFTYGIRQDLSGTVVEREVYNRTEHLRHGNITRSGTDFTTGRFVINFGDNEIYDYFVLSTDFRSHALIYTCKDIVNTTTSHIWSWKLSREKTMSAASNLIINTILAVYPDIQNSTWRRNDQNACDVNGGGTIVNASPILALVTFFFIGKELF